MIYFDNAATGGFKPYAVTDAVTNVVKYLCANPGRSGHRLSVTGAEIVWNTRELLADLFGASAERVIFTKNCTEALNVAILGKVRRDMHVVTTVYEHNSVLRPLFNLKDLGVISLDVVSPTQDKDILTAIKDAVTEKTGMVITTALSNVTGESLPIDKIGRFCKQKDIFYLVDGAQAGGHVAIDVKTSCVSALALACHKGLYGIMGSGALILNDDADLSPIILGGTGSESFNLNQPDTYPDKLESGTLNLPAIAGLMEGARYVKNNMGGFSKLLTKHTERIILELSKHPNVEIFSLPNPAGIVSFRIDGTPSVDVADTLSKNYDVAVRAGIHCAPLMHKYLGTANDGLCRVSLSAQNTSREISYFLSAVQNAFCR